MSVRKIALIDSNNVVVEVMLFNSNDTTEQVTISGLLSNPQSFEVNPYSQSVAGWKYIDGVEHSPEMAQG